MKRLEPKRGYPRAPSGFGEFEDSLNPLSAFEVALLRLKMVQVHSEAKEEAMRSMEEPGGFRMIQEEASRRKRPGEA